MVRNRLRNLGGCLGLRLPHLDKSGLAIILIFVIARLTLVSQSNLVERP
jgi:hypothetical protein